MSVNITERPTFEKRAVHFERDVLSSSYIHFEDRILNLLMVTVYQCDSIEIIL